MSDTMTSRTPTLVSHHSDTDSSKAKPRPSGSHSSTHSLSHGIDVAKRERSNSNRASTTGDKDKDEKPSSGGMEKGMVAPLQLTRWRFWAIFLSLMISIFLFALGKSSSRSSHLCRIEVQAYRDADQLILATAIPKITEAFNSLTELSWLASGFL